MMELIVAPVSTMKNMAEIIYPKEHIEKLKRWEQGKVQISKSAWARSFREA